MPITNALCVFCQRLPYFMRASGEMLYLAVEIASSVVIDTLHGEKPAIHSRIANVCC